MKEVRASVQVAQLSAVFSWGRQMCCVEPCIVDSGKAQILEFPLGFWLLSSGMDGCWGVPCREAGLERCSAIGSV